MTLLSIDNKTLKKIPETPGVYIMKDARGKILYIGKAGNLRRRVSSYFQKAYDSRVEKLVSQIKKIDYRKTDTAIEALILESQLIKKYEPPFNVKEKDDKSFLYVEITKEKFPRVLLVRSKDFYGEKGLTLSWVEGFGPFTSASSIREALRIIRRIFPYSVHPVPQSEKSEFHPNLDVPFGMAFGYGHSDAFVDWDCNLKPCFDYQIGLCPGTCIGAITRKDYLKNIKNIKLFLQGRKKRILTNLQKEMKNAGKNLEFEKAEKIRRQIFALQHIQDVALITDENFQSPISNFQKFYRIEGYDVSNISGTSAVGSMAVFTNGKPDKNEYRKFKIRTITQSDDVGMLKEILERRFRHTEWPMPDLILVDGGRGQINVCRSVLEKFGFKIPVIGIAKGPKHKKNEIIGKIPRGISEKTLIKIRDEAHRFAISYHRKLRGNSMRPSAQL